MFSKEKLLAYLDDKCCEIIIKDSLPSTNDYAAAHAYTLAGKAVVVAARQTAGKGTRGRSFYSGANEGLFFSLLLHPDIEAASVRLATPAAAVAVCRAIGQTSGFQCGIKWVNDIVIADKKLCGILAESRFSAETGKPDYLIIGIGINLCVRKFPKEIENTATSLDRHTDKVDAALLCASIINHLEPFLSNLEGREFLAEYRGRSSLLGRRVRFMHDGAEIEGVAADIDNDGALVVNVGGETHTLTAGDVSVRAFSE